MTIQRVLTSPPCRGIQLTYPQVGRVARRHEVSAPSRELSSSRDGEQEDSRRWNDENMLEQEILLNLLRKSM